MKPSSDIVKEIFEYFKARRFDHSGSLTLLARSDNENYEVSNPDNSLTNILLELAKLYDEKNTKIVVFINRGRKIEIPVDLTFSSGFFGPSIFHENEALIKLSIQKILELFESKSNYGHGSYYVRSFLESLYFSPGISYNLRRFDFDHIEDEMEETFKKSIVDFDNIITRVEGLEIENSKSSGNFKTVIRSGEYGILFDEESNELDKLLDKKEIILIRYEDGFKYGYFPAFLSYLLFYCSEKIKQSGKKGLFFIDNVSWFTKLEERPYDEKLSISDFSDYAIKSASGDEISFGEGIIKNRLVSNFFMNDRYMQWTSDEDYYFEIINKLIRYSWLLIYNINSLFFWCMTKSNSLKLSSIHGLTVLGEEHYKWRPNKRIPILVGDCEILHLIEDKSGFKKEHKKPSNIMRPTRDIRIFVSSPIEGYEEERDLAYHVIEKDLQQQAIMQKGFSAEGKPSIKVCLDRVRKSHIFILILKDKAGYSYDGKPISKWEFEEAKKSDIETLVFLSDTDKRDPVLVEWINELEDPKKGVFRRKFSNLEELKKQLIADLPVAFFRYGRKLDNI